MEESKQNLEENNSIESFSEIEKESNKVEYIKAFTEFPEKASNQNIEKEKTNLGLKGEKLETKNDSLLKRILKDGFDGITSNPNYKMLALLVILLINLSLFFVIGNIGKAFLRKTGIM